MNLKRFALQGMAVLLASLALCMFFARTVQSMTTPKVRLTSAKSGKLAKNFKLTAELHFPEEEGVLLPLARRFPVVVTEVFARAGASVKQDELLMRCAVADEYEKRKKLEKEYAQKAEELQALDVENRKEARDSERNRRHRAVMDAQKELSQARVAALAEGLGEEAWQDAQAAYDRAAAAFQQTYKQSSLSVKDEIYAYVLKRDGLIREMDELEGELVALAQAVRDLAEIRAPRDGIVLSVGVKEGDGYESAAPLYRMNAPDAMPVLRALTEEKFEAGTKAMIENEYDEQPTQVVGAGLNEEGKRCVDFALDEAAIAARGGLSALMKQEDIKVNLSSRAKESTTLIAASALRESDGETYVYVAERVPGGLLGDVLKVKKVTVTVLDRADQQVSVQEALTGERVIDREDRPIAEDTRVMEAEA